MTHREAVNLTAVCRERGHDQRSTKEDDIVYHRATTEPAEISGEFPSSITAVSHLQSLTLPQ